MGARRVRGIIFLLALLICTLSVGGAYATFNYSLGAIEPVEDEFFVDFFPWEGSTILPNEVVGQNHRELIENILNGTMKNSNGKEIGIGLNDPDSELNEQIANRKSTNAGWFSKPARDEFGSMDAWDSDQMHSLFGLEATDLAFVLYFPEDEENVQYLFTTGVDLGTSGNIFVSAKPTIPLGERVYPIYRTKLVYAMVGEDEKGNEVYEWIAEKTILGSCVSAYYPNDYLGTAGVQTPSFEPESFAPILTEDCESGESAVVLGTNKNNAVRTYVGATILENVASDDVTMYYFFTAKSNGRITISLAQNSPSITVTVYSDKNYTKEIASFSSSGTLTFNATSGTNYYVTATGNKSLNFTISNS